MLKGCRSSGQFPVERTRRKTFLFVPLCPNFLQIDVMKNAQANWKYDNETLFCVFVLTWTS